MGLHVGTCIGGKHIYSTVQGAVDAAVDGDVISICPGTYAEQVSVTKSLTLRNVPDMDSPQIVVPAGGLVQNTTLVDGTATAAQILVAPSTAGKNVKIMGLTVDAADNNNTNCALQMVGIYFKNAGGTIARNDVENQIGPVGHQNCQNGDGITVHNTTVGTGDVSITHNTVKNFDKNGIVMRYAGSVGTITRNVVTGLGDTDLLAQNGIELRDHASADITLNTVSGFVYTPATFGASAIILSNVSSAHYQKVPLIQRNNVSNADYGIVLVGSDGASSSDMLQVVQNTVFDTQYAGIGLESDSSFAPTGNSDYVHVASNTVTNTTVWDGIDVCSDNNLIEKNTVNNSPEESAIHLDALCEQANGDASGADNTVVNNRINSACIGIMSGQSDGANTIGTNKFLDVTNTTMFDSDDYSCSTTPARKQRHDRAKGRSGLRVPVSPGRH